MTKIQGSLTLAVGVGWRHRQEQGEGREGAAKVAEQAGVCLCRPVGSPDARGHHAG